MAKHYIPNQTEIRYARRMADLTQAEAADECCITPTTWASYEQGRYEMPAGTWKLFNFVVKDREQQAQINDTVAKPQKLTVYEQKKLDIAEAQRKEEAGRRRKEELLAGERQREMDNRARLRPIFDNWKNMLRIKFTNVDRDFANKEESAYLMHEAIKTMESAYNQFKDEIDARIAGTWVEPDMLGGVGESYMNRDDDDYDD